VNIEVGSFVRLSRMPEWVQDLPSQSKAVFEFCLGRVYEVVEIEENGFLVLDVSKYVDVRFGGTLNDIRVEREYVDQV
jgi:hypothetical protein